MKGLQIKKRTILTYIAFYWLLLQNAIISVAGGSLPAKLTGYVDELVNLWAVAYILYMTTFGRYRLRRTERVMVYAYGALLLLGAASTLVNGTQGLMPCLIDAFTCSKFILCYCAFRIYWKKQKTKTRENFMNHLNNAIRVLVSALFALVFMNLFLVQVFPVGKVRLFVPVQRLFFDRPADLSILAVICMAILVYNLKRHSKNLIFMLLDSFVCVATMRYKEVAVILLIWVLYARFFIIDRIKISNFVLIAGGVVIVAIFGFDQVMRYYGREGEARSLLLTNSFVLANRYFPLGSGFATYGSYMASVHYSKLYYEFGFDHVWGLNLNYSGYLTDAFFPVVIGQFGWFGLIPIFGVFYRVTRETLKIKDHCAFMGAIGLVAYLTVSTLGGTSLFNPISVLVALILSNMVVCYQEKRAWSSCVITLKRRPRPIEAPLPQTSCTEESNGEHGV